MDIVCNISELGILPAFIGWVMCLHLDRPILPGWPASLLGQPFPWANVACLHRLGNVPMEIVEVAYKKGQSRPSMCLYDLCRQSYIMANYRSSY